jgi:acetyl-CoA decarbonylase/synthase complex subunit beta
MHADGGYDRVVWMPSDTKEKLRQFIPASVIDAIATEKDVSSIPDLKSFLETHNHPVIQRWKAPAAEEQKSPGGGTVLSVGDIPFQSGGFRIIFKNARITADKVIIQPIRPGYGGDDHGAKKD